MSIGRDQYPRQEDNETPGERDGPLSQRLKPSAGERRTGDVRALFSLKLRGRSLRAEQILSRWERGTSALMIMV